MRDSILWVFFIGCVVAAVVLVTNAASADARRDEVRLVDLLARVSFNEALDSEHDLAMLWNITRAQGETARERYVWLAAHSPCVSGRLSQDEAYARPGNCRWTRNLHPDGRRPRGWDRARDGHWSRTRTRWLEHARRAADYVLGRRELILCPETPETWDGARYRERVLERGFEVLECKGDLRNLGVVRRVAPASPSA